MHVAVIGDVVGSRRHDRRELQVLLDETFALVAGTVASEQDFTMTIGDEFQGIFARLDLALVATFLAQTALIDRVGLRFGIGVGEVIQVGGAPPFQQDGSAWWRAREALDRVRQAERSRGTPPHLATGLVAPGHPEEEMTSRYLALRDHIVGGLDRTDGDIVLGLMNGETQAAIADRIGIDKGAVSRRVSRHGLSALLGSLPAWT